MKIYVGRWALLPEDWDGINGLRDKDEEEIQAELSREVNTNEGYADNFIAIYTRFTCARGRQEKGKRETQTVHIATHSGPSTAMSST